MSRRPRGRAVAHTARAINKKETAMPIFEYVCNRCKKQFEELVFGQDETAVCPSCGSTKTQKLMSCCRSKTGGAAGGGDDAPVAAAATPARSGGGCAGCSGGSCSSCG